MEKQNVHIAVVDDDDVLRKMISGFLRECGYEVSEAANGRILSQLWALGAFDLIICDLTMPEQEGLETLISLRLRGATEPILITSGFYGQQFFGVAKRLGATDTLPKPFLLRDLREKVGNLLAKYAEAEEVF